MKNASLWRAAAEQQDYEDDSPEPWERMRCGRGHFVARNAPTRDWVEYSTEPYDGPRYRLALPGERPDEVEIYCKRCEGWFQP